MCSKKLFVLYVSIFFNHFPNCDAIVQKRALEKWREKPQSDKWMDTFFKKNNSFDQISSLVNLLSTIESVYLNDCALVALYDYKTESATTVLLQTLFKKITVPHMQGLISKTYTTASTKLLTPTGNTCLNYLLFMDDVMHSYDLIGTQQTNKIVIVAKSSQWRVNEFLSSENAQNFVNIIVIAPSEKSVAIDEESAYIIYTHNMFVDALGSSIPLVLTSWYKGRFTRAVSLFPEKMQDGFAGHRFIVSAAPQPPFVIKKERDDNDDIQWDGIEVRLMKFLAEMYNFTVDLRESKDAELLGSGDAVTNDVKSKKANMGLAGLYVVPERLSDTDMSIGHTQDCATFISLTSTALPRWRAILGPFHWSVWIMLIFIYLLAIFPLSFSDRHTLKHLITSPEEIENMFWYVFGTFTNCFTFSSSKSWNNSTKVTTRLLIGFYWMFSIIITACYTGSIIAFVTLPIFPDTVETTKQLLSGRYQIETLDKGGWQYWFANSSDPTTAKLLKKVEYVPSIEAGVKNVTKGFFWSYAFLGSRDHLDYLVRSNFTSTGKRSLLHISSECFVPFDVAIMFSNNSVIKNVLNKGIIHAIENGFVKKFYSDVKWLMLRSATGKLLQANAGGSLRELTAEDRALVLDDTQGMFLLLGAGLLSGGIALLSEWLGGCFSVFKRRIASSSSSIVSNPRSYDAPTPRQKLDSKQFTRANFLGVIHDNETSPSNDQLDAQLNHCNPVEPDSYNLDYLFGNLNDNHCDSNEELMEE